ncbi:MAG: choice-of-anchor Q domain-containing protein [Candidatus Latescibacteria bacterium]|nr:choice-of-anchor Q domain-containing protein [Candidatus Latescibacterota bacterium]
MALQTAQGSPAVDAAIPHELITLDRWGRNRPVGPTPDIGADEMGPGDRPFDSLPEIPPPPVLMPDLYKGEYRFSIGRDSEFRLVDGSLEADPPLPDGFVMAWDYLPEQWASRASLTFSAGKDNRGYTLSWGGADSEGRPLGVITLRRGSALEWVADGPDIVHHRMTYNRARRPKQPERPPDEWYRFLLIKHRRMVWLALAGRRGSMAIPVVPVLVWQDLDTPLGGPGLRIEQTDGGVWRNLEVWSFEHDGDAVPPAPVDLTARSKGVGRIALSWQHGKPGRMSCAYEVYRYPNEDSRPTEANRIAGPIVGTGYDDFEPPAGQTLHYQVRARDVLGRTSRFVEARVRPARTGPMYTYLRAGSAEEVQPPLMLQRESPGGPELLVVPPNAGSLIKGPVKEGLARYGFSVPLAGQYALWGLARGPDSSADSFYLSLDDEALASYRGWSTGVHDVWMWRRVWQKELAAGEHTIRIKHRETGPLLKALLVTDDLDFSPAPP